MQQSSRKRLCSSVVHEQENERGCKPATDLCKDSEAFLVAHGLQALLHPCLLPASFWWATAELNVTLRGFQFLSHEQTLLESHDFARCRKELAFDKLAFARGCTDVWGLQQQPHLLAVRLVLDTALKSCTEASISQVTLRLPPFLAGWAERWLGCSGGSGAPPRLCVTIIQGYREAPVLRATTVYNLGLPTITSSPPHTTIYLPHF